MFKKICLVSTDLLGPVKNGGVGTATAAIAKLYADSKHKVTILYCNLKSLTPREKEKWTKFYAHLGIELVYLPAPLIPIDHGNQFPRIAYNVYSQLKNTNFDTIIFPDMHGSGYYCFLAKKCGLQFQKTNLIVIFHGPSEWSKKQSLQLLSTIHEISQCYIERQSIELADHVVFPTYAAENICNSLKIKPRSSTVILLPEFLIPDRKNSCHYDANFSELVFFGRIEIRKGIEPFLDSVIRLRKRLKSKKIKVTILGRGGWVRNTSAKSFLNRWQKMHDFKLNIVDKLDQQQAIRYLSKTKAFVVLPSLSETMGYSFLELLRINAAFACSQISAFTELIDLLNVENIYTFKPNDFHTLADTICNSINELRIPFSKSSNNVIHKMQKLWNELLYNLETPQNLKSIKSDLIQQKVSVCIPSQNRHNYLIELLDSLTRQTFLPYEVIICNDGSQLKDSIAFFERVQIQFSKVFPIKIIHLPTAHGPSYARNEAAKIASGDYILFKDDDNLSLPDETELLLQSALNNSSDIVTAPFITFRDQVDFITKYKKRIYLNTWIPVGDSPEINFFENVMGDSNFLIRTSAFQKTGGFDIRLKYSEDLEFLSRCRDLGLRLSICPEPTFLYRKHRNNFSLKSQLTHQRSDFFRYQTDALKNNSNYLYQVLATFAFRLGQISSEKPSPQEIKRNENSNPIKLEKILQHRIEKPISSFPIKNQISINAKIRKKGQEIDAL